MNASEHYLIEKYQHLLISVLRQMKSYVLTVTDDLQKIKSPMATETSLHYLTVLSELRIMLPTCDDMGVCELFRFSINCLTNGNGLE
jgi:hypothetical protein